MTAIVDVDMSTLDSTFEPFSIYSGDKIIDKISNIRPGVVRYVVDRQHHRRYSCFTPFLLQRHGAPFSYHGPEVHTVAHMGAQHRRHSSHTHHEAEIRQQDVHVMDLIFGLNFAPSATSTAMGAHPTL